MSAWRSTLLALALAMSHLPARAETLELLCEGDTGGRQTFLVDFERKTVQGLPASCIWELSGRKIVVPDCNPPGSAQISERQIAWTSTSKQMDGAGGLHNSQITASIDRQAGTISVREQNDKFADRFWTGKCGRATQKF